MDNLPNTERIELPHQLSKFVMRILLALSLGTTVLTVVACQPEPTPGGSSASETSEPPAESFLDQDPNQIVNESQSGQTGWVGTPHTLTPDQIAKLETSNFSLRDGASANIFHSDEFPFSILAIPGVRESFDQEAKEIIRTPSGGMLLIDPEGVASVVASIPIEISIESTTPLQFTLMHQEMGPRYADSLRDVIEQLIVEGLITPETADSVEFGVFAVEGENYGVLYMSNPAIFVFPLN